VGADHFSVMLHLKAVTMDKYSSYSSLAKSETEGVDYKRVIQPAEGALVAVIAPHAGGIEPKTGLIAQEIAGHDFSLYCFRGCKANGNSELHITSHRFDEPECVNLVSRHKWVVAIHGCKEDGERVFLGGRDQELIADLAAQLAQVGIVGETTGHHYLGTDPNNVCNRGQSNAGVQFELSLSFRHGTQVPAFIEAVRSVLCARQNAA
jgi:phage replication-related protein YjqB (UPF0714/DUF867 family)